jgi:hypothetical protein
LEIADKRVRFEGNAVTGFNARGEIHVGRDAIERPTDCDESGAGGKRRGWDEALAESL